MDILLSDLEWKEGIILADVEPKEVDNADNRGENREDEWGNIL